MNPVRRSVGILACGRKVAADRRDPASKETTVLKQPSPATTATAERSPDLWAFFRGELVPLRDANVNVMTHAFNYGTGVFEEGNRRAGRRKGGVRAWVMAGPF